MKQEIWLASYLQRARFSSFKRALKSFNDQTVKPAAAIISVCGPEAWRAAAWARAILKDIEYEIMLYDERWSQFDQLYMILKTRPPRDERVYISVCDDDDYYAPTRIEVQEKYLRGFCSPRIALVSGQDFGGMCFDERSLCEFMDNPLRNDPKIPPDVYFCALLERVPLTEKLHYKEKVSSPAWPENRPDGRAWFRMTF